MKLFGCSSFSLELTPAQPLSYQGLGMEEAESLRVSLERTPSMISVW